MDKHIWRRSDCILAADFHCSYVLSLQKGARVPVEKQIFHYLLSNIVRMVNNNTRNTEYAGTQQQAK